MGIPTVRSGRLTTGADVTFGENVVINVAEECVIGDRCVISDNAYFEGRRITLGEDCFCYSWEWRRLDVGRGRLDDEDAVLTVGARCTFHDNKIDLSASVAVGDDVGLSPEVAAYCHYYWLSPLDGYPMRYAPVRVCDGAIVGFRSTLLPGSTVGAGSVVGANSVVSGGLDPGGVYAGNPARLIRRVREPSPGDRERIFRRACDDYSRSLAYRGRHAYVADAYPLISHMNCTINVEARTLEGEEDEHSDDLRWFLFTRGVRVYTKRPFRKLGRAR